MKTHNSECKPLLRGVLIELFRWHPDPDRPGFECRHAQLAVWCPWCKRYHYHGWDPANNAGHAEHRCAHCSDGSPFRETGYFVSVFRKSDPEAKAHVVPPGKAIVRKAIERHLPPTPTTLLGDDLARKDRRNDNV